MVSLGSVGYYDYAGSRVQSVPAEELQERPVAAIFPAVLVAAAEIDADIPSNTPSIRDYPETMK